MADKRRELKAAWGGWPHLLKVLAAGVVVLWIFPIYWVVLTSFKSPGDINSLTPKFVFSPTLYNYEHLFNESEFGMSLINSVVISVTSCAIVMVLAIFAAYSMARLKVPGEKYMALWILSLRFMPPLAIGIPIYLAWLWLGLLDTRVGLILIYVSFNLPFAVWLLRGFLAELPFELEEAALLDGLSRLQIIRKIILPISLPGVSSATILTFVFIWNEYLAALLLTSYKAVTVPVTIAKFVEPYTILWGDLSAAVVIQLFPMLIIIFLLQKHIVRGVTMGAIK